MHRNSGERRTEFMPSNNSKYTEEMREQTAKYILENNKSATATAEEMGIDVNTVCRWVRDYRRKHNLPTYAEEKGIVQKSPQSVSEYKYRIKELEKELKDSKQELKKKDEIIAEEREKIEILKKSLHIFMQAQG